MYGNNVISTGFLAFSEGFAPNTGGGGGGGGTSDMLKTQYDQDNDGKVDVSENSLRVNNKEVQFDVLDTPISALEASDDWDSI